MSLSVFSRMEGLPIGWLGICSLMRSLSMLIPHAWQNSIRLVFSLIGIRQTLFILSHRAVGKLSLSACISSGLYGVSSIMWVFSKYIFFILVFAGFYCCVYCVYVCLY